MFLKKFSYIICIIFLLNNLYDIYEDSQSVKFIVKYEKFDNYNILFAFCIKFNEKLLENFNNSNNEYRFTVKELLESTCHKLFSDDSCEKLIYLNKSYLFNYHSCLIFNNSNFDILIRNLTKVSFSIFISSDQKSYVYFHENIFTNEQDQIQLKPFTLSVNYMERYFLESPYETNCYNYSNGNFDFKTRENIDSRPKCLYECFKTKSRSLSLYYRRDDNQQLVVTESDLVLLKGIGKWKTLHKNITIDHEKFCMQICSKRSCISKIYLFYQFSGTNQTKYNLIYNLKIYSAKPSITRFQSIINFISLTVLFLNISFYESIPFLVKNILSIFFKQYIRLFKKYYWLFKLIIFILCLSIVVILSIFRIIQYSKEDTYKLEAFHSPAEIIPFYLMICIPVQIFIHNHQKLDLDLEMNILNTKSFTELEHLTNFNFFQDKLIRVYVRFATIETDLTINKEYSIDKTKIVFKYFNYGNENSTDSSYLLRCYKVDFYIEELRYIMLQSLSKLKFILNFNWYIVYPMSKNFNLSTYESNLVSDPYIYLRKFKSIPKLSCIEYFKDKRFFNFSSRSNRIDQCVNDGHLKKHNNLTIRSVIYKETILSNELDKVYFNYSRDESVYKNCFTNFENSHNCFTESFFIFNDKPLNQINHSFTFYLYYPDFIISENIILTLSDLLLNNLLSFESIFLGLNVGKIFLILFVLLRKFKFIRLLKYYNYFKYLVFLIGLSMHFYLIIEDIISSELIFFQDFNVLKIQLPNLIFCFNYNRNSIDLNHKQTINYLDELTKDLNVNFFKNLSFVDNKYDEIFFVPTDKETFKNLEKSLTIYFLNSKCFEFIFKSIDYSKIIHLSNHFNHVSIKFNKKNIFEYFNSSSFKFFVISRKKSTNEMNNLIEIKIENHNNSYPFIKLYQRLNIHIVKEKFSYIKNPLSILYGTVNLDDTTEYINQISDDFSKINLRTLRIPAISINQNKDLEIDDELFDQYYYQIKNVTDQNLFRNSDFKREIYFTSYMKSEKQNDEDYDLKFYLNPIIEGYTFTNRDSNSKFIISILNCLNIWLNFCCLDIYIYLNKLCNLIFKFYKCLLRFKFNLKQIKIKLIA